MNNLKVVLFVSRNKDNKYLTDFKERRVSFLSDKTEFELEKDFNEFVERGRIGEKCRFYHSVNNRDNEKIRKSLIHYLVDHEEINMAKLDRRIASMASKKENVSEKKWLFDFDDEPEKIGLFLDDLDSVIPEHMNYSINKTPNGYAIITDGGFDSRGLLSKWSKVELKRDDMLCVDWKTKENPKYD